MKIISDRYYNFIGIVKRANKLAVGYDNVMDNLSKAKLVILAEEASDKLKEKTARRCKQKEIRYLFYGNSELYGKSLGSKNPVILAITDFNFSKVIIEKFGLDGLIGGERFGKS